MGSWIFCWKCYFFSLIFASCFIDNFANWWNKKCALWNQVNLPFVGCSVKCIINSHLYFAWNIFCGSWIKNNNFSVLHSGGVMIYFDRIEVVNMLVPSAGKSLKVPVNQKLQPTLLSLLWYISKWNGGRGFTLAHLLFIPCS